MTNAITLNTTYTPKPPGSLGYGGTPGEKLLKTYEKLKSAGQDVYFACINALPITILLVALMALEMIMA